MIRIIINFFRINGGGGLKLLYIMLRLLIALVVLYLMLSKALKTEPPEAAALRKLNSRNSLRNLTAIETVLKQQGWNPSLIKIVKAISTHETGYGQSRIAIFNNNLFGMKFPARRQTTAIGKDSNDYAIYDSPEDSVLDFVKWAEYSGFNTTFTTPEQVVKFMKGRRYYEDSLDNYLTAVKFYYDIL